MKKSISTITLILVVLLSGCGNDTYTIPQWAPNDTLAFLDVTEELNKNLLKIEYEESKKSAIDFYTVQIDRTEIKEPLIKFLNEETKKMDQAIEESEKTWADFTKNKKKEEKIYHLLTDSSYKFVAVSNGTITRELGFHPVFDTEEFPKHEHTFR